ncbi:hypothetical protein DFR29_12146 [Tahibacter aquaticus]|uniref:Uncharacterized protein n=1 Tax=Tahibacter aquaticus TaxID=520092 RepID=A0A4R6YMD1_9GAMM|nr:DUF5676 family membrane protein [Tahibacter aquaticus]TDR38374.1 hypothetical protein DFR29_12146 [Tahibacter aquaticus]
MSPIRTGVTLAITVGLFYGLCTVAWALAPGPFLSFMNNLFHGMDFSSMVRARPFAWPGFVVALLVLSTWALFVGMFYAWLANRLTR